MLDYPPTCTLQHLPGQCTWDPAGQFRHWVAAAGSNALVSGLSVSCKKDSKIYLHCSVNI